jgi:hypothetical protein
MLLERFKKVSLKLEDAICDRCETINRCSQKTCPMLSDRREDIEIIHRLEKMIKEK